MVRTIRFRTVARSLSPVVGPSRWEQIRFFATTKATATASGFSRLSSETDGWATGPNGFQKPGPNYKTHLVDGHPFGALVGRFKANGDIFFVGRNWTATQPAAGKLFFAINDNQYRPVSRNPPGQ